MRERNWNSFQIGWDNFSLAPSSFPDWLFEIGRHLSQSKTELLSNGLRATIETVSKRGIEVKSTLGCGKWSGWEQWWVQEKSKWVFEDCMSRFHPKSRILQGESKTDPNAELVYNDYNVFKRFQKNDCDLEIGKKKCRSEESESMGLVCRAIRILTKS